MTDSTYISAILANFSTKIKKMSYAEAINYIDKEIDNEKNKDLKICYTQIKGDFLKIHGHLNEALDIFEKALKNYPGYPGLPYSVGECLLTLGKYQSAVSLFTDCIELSKAANSTWYVDCARLMRAYCQAKLGRALAAHADLAYLDDEEHMNWVPVAPRLSKTNILDMLKQV